MSKGTPQFFEFSLQVTPEQKAMLELAARACGQTVDAFIVESAWRAAEDAVSRNGARADRLESEDCIDFQAWRAGKLFRPAEFD